MSKQHYLFVVFQYCHFFRSHYSKLGTLLICLVFVSSCAQTQLQDTPISGKTLGVHPDSIVSVAFTEAGKTAYSADAGGLIELWDVVSGEKLKSIYVEAPLALSSNGKIAVARGRKIYGVAWAFLNLEPRRAIGYLSGPRISRRPPLISSDGTRVFFGTKDLSMWTLKRGEVVESSWEDQASVWVSSSTVGFSPDDSMVALASYGGPYLEIRDAKSGEVMVTIQPHKSGTRAIGFSFDGTKIMTAGRDNILKLWDIRSGKLLSTFNMPSMPTINRILFSPQKNIMFTAHNDGSIIIWEVETWTAIKQFQAHEGWVEVIAQTPDGCALVTGGADKKVKYWDLGNMVIGSQCDS